MVMLPETKHLNAGIILIFSLAADLQVFGTTLRTADLKLQLSMKKHELPLFQGNTTVLNIKCNHTKWSNASAANVIIEIYKSFNMGIDSAMLSNDSLIPDYDGEGWVQFDSIRLSDSVSLDITFTIDPNGISAAGRVHSGIPLVRLIYRTAGQQTCKEVKRDYRTSFIFYTPDCKSFRPWGMSDGRIKESQLVSSSVNKPTQGEHGRGPDSSRLGSPSFWAPASGNPNNDKHQYVQVQFREAVDIKMIAMQKRERYNGSLHNFNVYTSENGVEWSKHQQTSSAKGKHTRQHMELFSYEIPPRVRFFRINPEPSYEDVNLRFEVYGCTSKAIEEADIPLGMESGAIGDSQLSVSNQNSHSSGAEHGRLNLYSGGGAWCTGSSDLENQFFQIDLGKEEEVVAIATQARPGNFNEAFRTVTSFWLRFSSDGTSWKTYQQNGVDKLFVGTLVEGMGVKRHLPVSVTARYIRFIPKTKIGQACMRVEVYKYNKELNAESAVYEKSFLLDENNDRIFVCNRKTRGKPSCYVSSGTAATRTWKALDYRLTSILAYNKASDTIYGVGWNNKVILQCEDCAKCLAIPRKAWIKARQDKNLNFATEIPFIPVTDLEWIDYEPRRPMVLDGTWGATSLGIYFKANNGIWEQALGWHEYDLLHCEVNSCYNGGTCREAGQTFQCLCPPGFLGSRCETETDECNPLNPCKNEGVCSDFHLDYICECLDGYGGRTCDKDVDECDSQPCQNGGTCTDLVAAFKCDCPVGWIGDTCNEIDDCVGVSCMNGGACVDGDNNYTCLCAAGFLGRNCSEVTNECDPNPCYNGGNCTDKHLDYHCDCLPGFHSSNCYKATDECSPNPCNGRSCTDLHLNYTCDCGSGLLGRNCEIDFDECNVTSNESALCLNNGTCINLIGSYECSCVDGWIADDCSEKDDCVNVTCLNGGDCVDGSNIYTCSCKHGFTGRHCEKVVYTNVIGSCGNTYWNNTESTGTIRTPRYPSKFPSKTFCTWLITSSARVRLEVKDLYTKYYYQRLSVYDGSTKYARRIRYYEGYYYSWSSKPNPCESSGSTMFLYFKDTYYYGGKKGFDLRYVGVQ